MNRKIDFDRYKEPEKKQVAGGLLVGSTKERLCQDKALQNVIDTIEPDSFTIWVSEGNWSMHHLLLSLLNITGAAEVTISSYAMCENAARVLSQLKSDEMILRLECVLDNRVHVRSAGSWQLIKAISDRAALVSTHAKVTVIKNPAWNITVIGSANYTENERYEAGVIATCADVANHQLQWIHKALNDANKT